MAEEKKQAAPAVVAKPATGEAKKRRLVKGRHASAIKRHRQSLKRTERNRAAFATLRSAIKKVRESVAKKDTTLAQNSLHEAVSLLHRASFKGIIHHRNASRQIARLSSSVSHLS